MVTLAPDEVTLIKSVLTALRGIKVRDIDRALLILSKIVLAGLLRKHLKLPMRYSHVGPQ